MTLKEINLFGDITDETVIGCINSIQEHLESERDKLIENRKDIVINVYSDGGSADAMLALCDIIEDINKNGDVIKIHTHLLRKAYSAGFPIWLCGFNRTASRSAEAMFHDIHYGVIGVKEKHKEYMDIITKLENLVDDIIIENFKITKDELNLMRKEGKDRYFDRDELIKGLKVGYRRYKK